MAIYRGAGGSGDAINDSSSEAIATIQARDAALAAQAAAESAETNASNSASSASSSATSASNSASAAATSASNAATSASSAASSASTATTQASNASSSASAAATSATAAQTAQTAAETARDQTLAAYDNFDDRYLGTKTSDPTLDNDGNALVAGSLYFNSTTGAMKVYTGSAWVDAYTSGTTFLAKSNNLSDLTNTATARTNLGVAIGTNVQAWDADLDTWATKTAPSGTVVGTTDSQTLTNKTIALGSNTVSGTIAQFNTAVTDADLATLAGSETLTNKTLTSPVISTISNTGTLTLPTSTDTLVGRATSDTLSNKTIVLGSNTVSGTLAQFNTAVTDADLVSIAGSETLTNKTLTSPTINTPVVSGGSIDNTPIGATTANTGRFTTLESTSTGSFGTASAQYIQAVGSATEPQILAVGSGTNIPLVLQPKGTGSIQAQATTSTTAGGNARGANAVDWQTVRDGAAKVASGSASFIGSGSANTASSTFASVVGGSLNTASNTVAFVGGGSQNTSSGNRSCIVGGDTNTTAGFFNFVGGGFTNSGTSGTAVTTQAAATNGVTSGSTAVTLAASNASIRVGQLITGTGIVNFTYVAAISGTSLTLSQAANQTGTPTLSFFTPHGVVVGGGNNQATGAYSFIGGGGDAGTAGNRNTASGDYSSVVGGRGNTASGIGAFVGGGGFDGTTQLGNTASGSLSVVGGGYSNTASGSLSTVFAGFSNTANSSYGFIGNGARGTTRGIVANQVFPACVQPIAASAGVSQTALLVLGRQTTDATPTVLASDSNAAGTTNQVILPNNSAYLFKATVVSGVTGGGNTSGWKLEGVIKRGANAASTTLVGTVTTTLLAQDAGASTWTIAATADTTNGGLRFTFTGQAGTTIRTVCKVETTEMTF